MAIEGGGALTPQDKKLYRQEYQHSADLFQRALDEYSESDNIYQKEEFKGVMDMAMQVMNETARELNNPNLLVHNQKIAADLAQYEEEPTPVLQKEIQSEINQAKRSV